MASGNDVAIETACQCRINAEQALNHIAEEKLTVVPNGASVEPGKTAQFGTLFHDGDVTYSTTNASVATIDQTGLLRAVAAGEVKVEATDANGVKALSRTLFIGAAPSAPPGGECPLGNPILCQLMCVISPDLPWCNQT
jgi:thermitase